MNIPFKRGNILLPKNTDMTKWSVVACDQYTSEPEYWNDVEKIVGDAPSTLKLTLPEIYLEDKNISERIAKINSNMKALLDEDFFNEYKDSMIYLERTQSDGKIREGLIGVVDLEAYSYEKGAETPISNWKNCHRKNSTKSKNQRKCSTRTSSHNDSYWWWQKANNRKFKK